MNKLMYSPEAKRDLEEIKRYISEDLSNISAAINTLFKITKNIRKLQDFPESGAPLSSIVEIETDYRFLVCGNYTAFYRNEDDTVFVDRVLYSRRDFMKIIFGKMENQ